MSDYPLPVGYPPFEFSENLRGTPRRSPLLVFVEISPPPPGLGQPIKEIALASCGIITQTPARIKSGRACGYKNI